MADTFEFKLDEESEKKLFEIMTDFNTEKIPSFTITDKYGNTAEYVKVVRCENCKHRPEDDEGYLLFPDDRCPCHCEDDWYDWMPKDNWYCGNAERREE